MAPYPLSARAKSYMESRPPPWSFPFPSRTPLIINPPPGQVHAGFLKAYHEMHPGILKFLKAKNKQHLPVLCVGHSMGGSLATICARYLAITHGHWDPHDKATHGKVALYTFGSPRTGNDAFVNGLNESVVENWRLVCEDDVVPSLPHEDCGCWARILCSCYKCNTDYAKPTGYRHVGTEVGRLFLTRYAEASSHLPRLPWQGPPHCGWDAHD